MPEVRQRFHEELRALEGEVQQTGAQAQLLLDKALEALAGGDLGLCAQVIDGDDEVDRLYLDVERRILHLFALQTPVASDLRLLTALLHINLHLERVGDQAVNLAKITTAADGLPQNPTVLQDLGQMGAAALGMVGAAMEALARRDLALARQLPELDDPIDDLNRGMLAKVLAVTDDQRMLEWGVRMYVASRQIERIGDNAVDIGEQVAFLITGQFREFTDASHPEVEHPKLVESGDVTQAESTSDTSSRADVRTGEPSLAHPGTRRTGPDAAGAERRPLHNLVHTGRTPPGWSRLKSC
jgi:phosphate transport system protein